jgi:hypothetical protein
LRMVERLLVVDSAGVVGSRSSIASAARRSSCGQS